ncbi:Nuclear cap-binding protein subunit 3 [Fasciolopsis buskii]|uniref:Nuclear cap-binding protein subunit 3 n=1 Tax=Fasciolopsis buskii TaxID=27845 RepID=A0A8E0RIQ3_9TREM|nr:Nuclear cap-binding protein subunit 3 [Fasciolopsis buski]
MVDSAEPFDRRVALAAAAALASFVESKEALSRSQNQLNKPPSPGTETDRALSASVDSEAPETMTGNRSLHVSTEALDSIEEFSQYLPPTGRWYKALSVPSKAISLFLRFAHKNDVKLPGAERRSLYYRRYGNPNYGGMTGILSRSYRRRLKLSRLNAGADSDGNMRHVRILPSDFAEVIADAYDYPDLIEELVRPRTQPAKTFPMVLSAPDVNLGPPPERSLVVYDNLYETNEHKSVGNGGRWDNRRNKSMNGSKVNPGQRREAIGFPTPGAQWHPRKWPRRDRGPPPNRWLVDDYRFSPPDADNIRVVDLREPWAAQASPLHEPFVFSGNKSTSNRRSSSPVLDALSTVPDGTTITLMPDSDPIEPNEDENAYRTRRLLASMSMVADMEEHTIRQRPLAGRVGLPNERLGAGVRIFNGSSNNTRRSGHDHRRHRSRDVWQRLG